MIYAIVDRSGRVVNNIEWDGQATWTPPAGCDCVLVDRTPEPVVCIDIHGEAYSTSRVTHNGSIGEFWNGRTFTRRG